MGGEGRGGRDCEMTTSTTATSVCVTWRPNDRSTTTRCPTSSRCTSRGFLPALGKGCTVWGVEGRGGEGETATTSTTATSVCVTWRPNDRSTTTRCPTSSRCTSRGFLPALGKGCTVWGGRGWEERERLRQVLL